MAWVWSDELARGLLGQDDTLDAVLRRWIDRPIAFQMPADTSGARPMRQRSGIRGPFGTRGSTPTMGAGQPECSCGERGSEDVDRVGSTTGQA